ncbi:glycosyltransferase family 1 protein [Microbacterium sp. STN6]|uniref:glycosyltransferase family 4 protein n=1 Tax=Microbacterium sp. STN6 TaxID=2995588 RepID=UPI0022609179|nr:glycosyltransferase family 1 protein [Microbacterium sp. STN6]MCX7521018.1 glycosyltransferase family 1 protein [Microbacterium sp. STN6]
MATLRVVVDPLISADGGGIGRYTRELTSQLIETAPRGCDVEGIVASHAAEKYERLEAQLPGLVRLHTVPLRRRELARAWQYGIGIPIGPGMIHSPGLLAPLMKHDRTIDGTQVVVTIHDTLAYTHPESLKPRDVQWQKAMIKRARKHADAIVVPTHAVATQLGERFDFGDRIRVISGAPAATLRLGSASDADERARALGLPPRYILAMGGIDPRKGLRSLIAAMALPETEGLPLLIAGAEAAPAEEAAGAVGVETAAGVAAAAGLAENRVRMLGQLDDADLAVALDRAAVFVYPSLAEGFGLPVIEAFRFGTPVVHSDDPALTEVADGAGLSVPRADAAGYPRRLADAIGRILGDAALAEKLGVLGQDRARAFSWRDSAERIWQLHADL